MLICAIFGVRPLEEFTYQLESPVGLIPRGP